MNRSRKCSARARRVELGALVGDRDEMVGPARDAGVLQTLAEVRGQRVRLDRRARLAREQVQRAVGRRRGGAHRGRIGRVEHVQPRPARRDAEDRAQHLRREARSAHAEQHDVGEAVALDAGGERLQPVDRVGHQQRRAQPAETIGDLLLRRRIGGSRPTGSRCHSAGRRALARPRSSWRPLSARPGDRCSEFWRRARLAATSSAGQRVISSCALCIPVEYCSR